MAEQTINTDNFIATLTKASNAYYVRHDGGRSILAEVIDGRVQLCSCPFFSATLIMEFAELIKKCSKQFMETKTS